MYELLTGNTPFDEYRLKRAAFDEIRRIIREEEPPKPSTRISTMGGTVTAVAAHRQADPLRLAQLLRGDLDWIVMKALDKDRTRRYDTATGLALDVERYLADEPVRGLSAITALPGAEICAAASRRGVGRLGRVLGAGGRVHRHDLGDDPRQRCGGRGREVGKADESALSDREAALATAKKSERMRSEELWQALVSQARSLRLSRRPGQRFESLDRLQQAAQLARALDLPRANFHEMRNAAIAALAVPDLYLSGPWHPWPADGIAVDFDEAQTLYARTDRAGGCSIRRVTDDAEIYRLPPLGWPAYPSLSQDGKFIVLTQFNRSVSISTAIHVWQLEGAAPRQILSEPKAQRAEFQGSRQIALGYKDGSIGLFELPTARQVGRLAPDTITQGIVTALHPTEPLVAACSYPDQLLQVRDVRTGKVLASMPQTDRPLSLAWHPDGRTLAVGCNLRRIRIYDRITWQVEQTLETENYPAWLAFDSKGDRLAVRDYEMNVELFCAASGERLMKSFSTCSACRFSRDRLRLAGGVQKGSWESGASLAGRNSARCSAANRCPRMGYASARRSIRTAGCASAPCRTPSASGIWRREANWALYRANGQTTS